MSKNAKLYFSEITQDFSKSSLPNSGIWCWSAAPFTLHLACSQLINTNLLRADDCSFLFTLFSTQKTRLLQMFLTLSTRLYTTLTLNQLNHSHNLLHFHSYNLLFSILIKSLFNSQLDPFFTNKRNISPQCLLSFSISCTRETSMFHVHTHNIFATATLGFLWIHGWPHSSPVVFAMFTCYPYWYAFPPRDHICYICLMLICRSIYIIYYCARDHLHLAFSVVNTK